MKLTRFHLALLVSSFWLIAILGAAAVFPPLSQILPPPLPAAASLTTTDTPEDFFFESGGAINSLVVHNNMVFWSVTSTTCPGGEFSEPCIIRRKPAGGGGYFIMHNNTAGPSIRSNLAADASYIYWANSSGQIVRIPRTGWGITTPTVLATKENSSLPGEVAVDNNYVYWTENDSGGGSGKLFRAAKGGGARQEMYNSPYGVINQMKADGAGGVLFIANCFLCPDTLTRVTPSGSGFTAAYGRSYLQSYAVSGSVVYFALDFGATNLHLESAPLTNLSGVTQGPDLSDTAVPAMTADDTNLYFQHNSGASGPLFRLPLASFSSGSPTAITADLGASITDLYNSDSYLFWRKATTPINTVYRLSKDAAAVQVDASVANVEVTQGIQNLNNDVTPVQNKWTMVRVYPALSSSAFSSVPATVRLYGTRDGSPLPGSPLPAETITIKTSGYLRQNLTDTANFILPPSWLTGTVQLTAEISVFGLYDTNPANDSASVTANFARKANVCVKFVPIETTSGLTFRVRNLATGDFTPGFQEVYRRFTTLWPTPYVPYYTNATDLRKPCLLCAPNPPFNMVGAADKEWINFALYEHNIWDNAPDYCGGNNARTHYVAMVHPGIDTGNWLGFASYGESLSSVKFTQGGGASWEIPMGGSTMAQELGHNFNDLLGASNRWKHVNCGLPTGGGFHPGYPYPPCQIGPSGDDTTFWGFDRLTDSIIQPEQATDFMSYGANKWVSDYTWSGLMAQTSDLPASASLTSSNAETLIVAGLVTEDETAGEFAIVYRVDSASGAAQQAAELARAKEAAVSPHSRAAGSYALELLSATGSVLASQAITPDAGTHFSAGPEDYLYFTTIPFAPGTAALRVTKDGVEIARRTVSANAPVVTITQPTAGANVSDNLTIAWSGSDADGDPLKYVVQYSADGGANWTAVATGYVGNSLVLTDTTNLPGSGNARVRVIASDGVNTGMATSAAFTMQGHAPWPMIDAPVDGKIYLNQEAVTLEGLAQDPEEGFLDGSALDWAVTGPVTRFGTGSQVTFTSLPPGPYTAVLTATDSTAQTAVVTSTFFVSPKRIYDGGAAVVDGYCNDAAYDSDTEPILLRYANLGETALVRFSYNGGNLFVCYDGLPASTGSAETVALNLDLNNSGDTFSQADDLIVQVRRDGSLRTGYGDGAGNELFDTLPQGVTAMVSQDNGIWRAEIRIDSSQLSGAGSLIRLFTDHFSGLEYTRWPQPVLYNNPASWGLVTLDKQNQTISFASLPDQAYESSLFTLAATASSGLPVSYTSDTPAVCAVSGRIVTLLATGTCRITAAQSGNSSYNAAAPVSRSFTIFTTQKLLFLPVITR